MSAGSSSSPALRVPNSATSSSPLTFPSCRGVAASRAAVLGCSNDGEEVSQRRFSSLRHDAVAEGLELRVVRQVEVGCWCRSGGCSGTASAATHCSTTASSRPSPTPRKPARMLAATGSGSGMYSERSGCFSPSSAVHVQAVAGVAASGVTRMPGTNVRSWPTT